MFGPVSLLTPDALLRRCPFFGDWLQPQRLFANLSGAVFFAEDVAYGINLYRPRGRDDFGRREVALIHVLYPHLRRAMLLHRRIEGVSSLHAAAIQTLERSDRGVVLLGPTGSIVFVNHRARAILGARDGLSDAGCRLRAGRMSEDLVLRAAVARAVATAVGDGIGEGGALTVSRASGRRSYQVLVSPVVWGVEDAGAGRVCAVAFVTDPECGRQPPTAWVRATWDLTPTQVRVAELLATGMTVDGVAGTLAIARATARTHVREVLRKTGARRQSDLVRQLLVLPNADDPVAS
jgi:DNA-binding CsgD family transcriptional regulator